MLFVLTAAAIEAKRAIAVAKVKVKMLMRMMMRMMMRMRILQRSFFLQIIMTLMMIFPFPPNARLLGCEPTVCKSWYLAAMKSTNLSIDWSRWWMP